MIKEVKEINFEEKSHKYFDDTGEVYTSVTTLIHQYSSKYDTEYWAMYTALKDRLFKVKPEPAKQIIYINGVANKLSDLVKDSLFKAYQEATKAEWKVNTEVACFRGNVIHNKLEDSINGSKGNSTGIDNSLITRKGEKVICTQHDLDKTELETEFPEVYKRLSGYIYRGFSIFAEKKVHLEKYKLAGMIDVPLLFKNYFAILDWKTNKDELRDTPGYYKKKLIDKKWVKTKEWIITDDRFSYPLEHLPSSKLMIYSMQLSTYAYILEQWGYKLLDNGLEIIHFPEGDSPKLIRIPYMKKEVEMMLDHHARSIA